jgi:serine/threonine protein kinase
VGLTRITPGARIELGLCSLEFQRAGLPAAVFHFLPEGFLRETRYNLGEAVVEGSTSTIYNAFDTTLRRDVAMKVLRPEVQMDMEHVLRFIREAQITSQLQHPGILTVYELGLNEQTQLYCTTRFVEADPFSSILDNLSSRDPDVIAAHSLGSLLTTWQKACDAVAYANAHGVIHSSLRPDSITCGSFGEVIVISWSCARLIDTAPNGSALTRSIQAAPMDAVPPLSPFCPPEIAAEEWDQVSARTDVYSLGAILYRMITLHRPIAAEDEDALFEAIINGSIRSPSDFAQEPHPHCPGGRYPGPLITIAMKAMSRNPEDRYQGVPELQAAVAAWQEGLTH